VVVPEARGSGIGLALMQHAVELAKEHGIEKLLSCSHPDVEPQTALTWLRGSR
jgi:N-acetylglutamate synthase-like GNAT family acetyltransferase